MKKTRKLKEVTDYDQIDTTAFIDSSQKLSLQDLGFALPEDKPSKVVSIRLPSKLLNALQSLGSEKDIPYQSLIKMYLWERVEQELS